MIIEVYVSDEDAIKLAHDIPDISEWLNGSLRGKAASCGDRMVREWLPRLLESDDVSTLPATDEGIVAAILEYPGYQDRITRDSNI